MAVPPLQSADAKSLKSPRSIASVGTNAILLWGLWCWFVPWYPPKKNSLSCTIGPPAVPPHWLRDSPSSTCLPLTTFANGSMALNRWSRLNSNRLPENRFVPDLVIAFTDAPECMPFCAVSPVVATRNSCSASGKRQRQIGVVLRVVVHRAVEEVRDAERQSAGDRHVRAACEAAAVRTSRVHRCTREHEQAR